MAMDITTSLESPSLSSQRKQYILTATATIIFKLAILGYLYTISFDDDYYSDNYEFEIEEGGHVVLLLDRFRYPLFTLLKYLIQEKMMTIYNFGLPRLVAAAFTYHIGFCCSFVGLVHLKVIKPR